MLTKGWEMQGFEITVKASSIRDLRRKLAKENWRPIGKVDAWVSVLPTQNTSTVRQALIDWLGDDQIKWRWQYHGKQMIMVEVFADASRRVIR